MPEERKTSVVVIIFKGKGDVMDCGANRGVKLLEHAIKIVATGESAGEQNKRTGNDR